MTKRILLASSALCLSLLLSSAASALAQDVYPNPNANMEVRLSAVEDQIRALTGKVEQFDFIARRMDQALQRMQQDYDTRLMKLETAPPPPQPTAAAHTAPTPTSTPNASAPHDTDDEADTTPQQPVVGTLGGVKVKGDKVTGGVINPKSPPLPKTPEDYGLTAQEQYDKAFGLLRQANYDDAERAFKSFIDKHGNDKLIDNAKYWYAETYYVRGKFNDSAIAFADAFQQNPKGTKAPDSLLKLAMSLGSMDKTTDACGALDALKAKYPNAPATIKARADQERSRMKCK